MVAAAAAAAAKLLPARLLCPWNSPGQNTDWIAVPFFKGSS